MRRRMARALRVGGLELAVIAVSGIATVAMFGVPSLDFVIDRPALHLLLEVVAGMTAGLLAFLLYGRSRRSGRRDDLLLTASLSCMGVSHLAFAALPQALVVQDATPEEMWATVPAGLIAAVLFVAAALAGGRPARPREPRLLFAGVAGALLATAAGVAAITPALPDTVATAGSATAPDLAAHPVIVTLQIVAIAAFGAAALRFARRARAERDAFLRGLGIAAILAGFARVHYLAYPTIYTHVVASGDAFRLVTHVVLLAVSASEIRRYWTGLAHDAVLAERRRIGRDLHDGVAQELAFIVRRARRLSEAGDHEAGTIATAARRALEDSRRAIHALARDPAEPLDVTLAAELGHVAARTPVPLRLDLEPAIHLAPPACDALVRIACEAVANATRHARPDEIVVELRNGNGVHLRVTDDGTGFDPTPAARGFGLRGMQERAHSVGGRLDVRSRPGHGTEIEAVMP